MSLKKSIFLTSFILLGTLCTSCGSSFSYNIDETVNNAHSSVNYEIFVGSFYDSNNDKMGDLNGVTAKLDYLQQLGVHNLWLMPIHPSESYHKYDVDDYYAIDKAYGTMNDFDNLIAKAKEKNMGILVDLVMNHSSNQHPWFIESMEDIRSHGISGATGKGKWYNWISKATYEENPGGYSSYRSAIDGNYYYEGRFSSSMPDLNLDNEEVINEFHKIAKFYIDKGVAGFRLDAVTSFFSGSPTKNCAYLKQFSNYCHSLKNDIYIIGEVLELNEGICSSYYDSGVSLFSFPSSMSETIYSYSQAINAENAVPVNMYATRAYDEIKAVNPLSTQAALLSNHDQNRSANFITTTEKRKMAASAYLLTPGTPFIYYGEEIEMNGGGRDENKRTHMIWSESDKTGECSDPKNAETNPKQVTKGVYDKLKDNDSLLNHYRKVINLRNKYYEYFTDGKYVSNVSLEQKNISSYKISKADQSSTITLFHNFSKNSTEVSFESNGKIIEEIQTNKTSASFDGKTLKLAPYSSVIIC